MAGALVDVLLRSATSPVTRALARTSGLADALAQLVGRATAAWPQLAIDPAAFVEHVAGALREDAVDLAGLHAEDLALAFACSRHVVGAAEIFEARYGAEIDRGLARLEQDGVEDLQQRIRERLLVGSSGSRPRLAEYAGRGPLLHWLRVTVVRMRADAVRRKGRAPVETPETDALIAAAPAIADPEMAYLRAHYGDLLRTAFAEAVGSLTAEQRNLLRQHVVAGLASSQIAGVYGVHHATAKRWLARAREDLWRHTRQRVMFGLGLSRHQFDSIVRLVQSELDLSVARLLDHDAATPSDG